MRVIYKYPLDPVMNLPRGAEVLSIQERHGQLTLWALVEATEHAEERRRFVICGTGCALPLDLQRKNDVNFCFLATMQTASGLVWHIFEKCGWQGR